MDFKTFTMLSEVLIDKYFINATYNAVLLMIAVLEIIDLIVKSL